MTMAPEALLQVNAAVRAAANTVSQGGANPIAAGMDAVLQPGGTNDLPRRYNVNLAQEEDIDHYNARYRPVADKVGTGIGLGLELLLAARYGGGFGLGAKVPRLANAAKLSRPEALAAVSAGAAGNVATQYATDAATGHRTTGGDAFGAALGGGAGGAATLFGPKAGATVNGFVTSVAQDIGNHRPVDFKKAGFAASASSLVAGRTGQAATRKVEALPSHTKGRLGEYAGPARAALNGHIARPNRTQVRTPITGQRTVPDGIAKRSGDDVHLEYKHGSRAKLSKGQLANQAERGANFILYHFMPEDFGKLASAPIGIVAGPVARLAYDQFIKPPPRRTERR